MSVKPVASAAIVSPAPIKPEASTEDKVSKFMQNDKLPSSRLAKKPTRNFAVHHLTTIEETDETGEISEPIRTSTPVNLTPPVTKPPKVDFRKVALLNKAMTSDNLK